MCHHQDNGKTTNNKNRIKRPKKTPQKKTKSEKKTRKQEAKAKTIGILEDIFSDILNYLY